LGLMQNADWTHELADSQSTWNIQLLPNELAALLFVAENP